MDETKKYTAIHFDIGFDYVETMGLRIKNGRSFQRTLKTDQEKAVIVNEAFVNQMGLFGLISLTISKRMKEISIRKVLGASAYDIIQFINKDFMILIILASVIALPGSYFTLTYIFDGLFKYNCGVGSLALIVSFVFVIATALLTVSSLVYKAAISNPSDNLRFE
ncbi:FtsX-like permease family protein [candidate division KSB1 bacterium]|nr:FtsX-like permease family protein [candidate division KSB1 bacterium]MBL7093573.1 FtsX-like permease family protein [candidate division KSB1 bacterium]